MMSNRKLNDKETEILGNEDMYDCIRLIWKKIRSFFTIRPIPEEEFAAAELAC